MAEMRQWCATASKYEGLYATIATAPIPTEEETARLEFRFDPAHSFDGLRGAMVETARKWDLVKLAQKRSWESDPDHPDVVPLQEAVQLHQLFETCSELDEIRAWPDDFRSWLEDGRFGSEELVGALAELGRLPEAGVRGAADVGARAEALERAKEAYGRIAESCSSCHAAYRD